MSDNQAFTEKRYQLFKVAFLRKRLQTKHLTKTLRETLDLLVGYPGLDFIVSANSAAKELVPDLPAGVY